MLSVLASLVLGLVLLAAAGLKVAGGAGARAALATYGVRGPRAAYAAWAGLIGVEAALGAGVAAGLDGPRARPPCSWPARARRSSPRSWPAARARRARASARAGASGTRSAGRAAALAAAFALLPLLPRREPDHGGWLAIGLGVALLGLVALAVVVLALAREVGMLRLAVSPRGALEVAHEGPEIGARSALLGAFGGELDPGQIGLAVFTSGGLRAVPRARARRSRAFGAHAAVALRTFDEVADADAWAAADVPGSPFAVALDADGTVLAKGTFNTGAQLESVLAAAERRRGAVRA